MTIFLVRHGETTGDLEGRYGGDYDDHLTEQGIAQSRELARKLKDQNIQAIYTSPLLRAQETAGYIKETTGSEVNVMPALKERNNYGVMTGLTKEEALSQYPDQVPLLQRFDSTVTGAESYEEFGARMTQLWESLTTLPVDRVVAVCHSGPIRFIFRSILKIGEFERVQDCALVELEKTDAGFRLVRIDNAQLSLALVKPGVYRHFKGMEYRVIGMGKHSETLDDMVIYEALYDNPLGKTFVRPLRLFTDTVNRGSYQGPRFTFLRNS